MSIACADRRLYSSTLPGWNRNRAIPMSSLIVWPPKSRSILGASVRPRANPRRLMAIFAGPAFRGRTNPPVAFAGRNEVRTSTDCGPSFVVGRNSVALVVRRSRHRRDLLLVAALQRRDVCVDQAPAPRCRGAPRGCRGRRGIRRKLSAPAGSSASQVVKRRCVPPPSGVSSQRRTSVSQVHSNTEGGSQTRISPWSDAASRPYRSTWSARTAARSSRPPAARRRCRTASRT